MMTFSYLNIMIERNLTQEIILEEIKEICTLFNKKNKVFCQESTKKQLENIFEYELNHYTFQQYCHSIGDCKKPGPSTGSILEDHLNNIIKPVKKAFNYFSKFFKEL